LNPFLRQVTFYLVIALVMVLIFNHLYGDHDVEEIGTSRLFDMIESGEIEQIHQEGRKVTAEAGEHTYEAEIPPEENIREEIRTSGHDIDYDYSEPTSPWWSNMLVYMLPFLLLIGLFVFFMQQTQGGGSKVMNFGKSKARLYEPEQKNVTFKEVAGADEEKAELVEIVDFLKDPKKFIELGARIPKGVLLVGPPGTGKTLLGRAVAGEAGVPFFSISGSDFVEMFVGVGASRVRDLFENAKKNSPCIVFMDEIDAVGRQRGAGLGGGHDEREQTLNQLLVEMDGFDINEGIILIAATNRPDILDPALLRPGRFDRQITVNYPDIKGREEILRVHVRNKPLNEEVDLKVVARRTPGFTGADLENAVNEAALLAARRNSKVLCMQDMEGAIDRVIAGTEKKSKVISDFEKTLVAYHETGHALVGYLLPNTDPVHKVSIIPRGKAGGYTLMLPEEDRYYMTRSELMDRVTALLAGRVAEESVLGEVSTGAQNDLERATSIVRQMIMEYGMSEELGPITLGNKQGQVFLGRDLARDRDFSEEIAKAIDREIRQMIDKCYSRAQEIIEENHEKLEFISKSLLEKETLDASEIEALMEGRSLEELEEEREKAELEKEEANNSRNDNTEEEKEESNPMAHHENEDEEEKYSNENRESAGKETEEREINKEFFEDKPEDEDDESGREWDK